MTTYRLYDGIPVACGHCGKDFKRVEMVILWANQHGVSIRIFCKACGGVTDRTRVGDRQKAVLQSWKTTDWFRDFYRRLESERKSG